MIQVARYPVFLVRDSHRSSLLPTIMKLTKVLMMIMTSICNLDTPVSILYSNQYRGPDMKPKMIPVKTEGVFF